MEEWIVYSAMSCFLYAFWAVNMKLASKTIDPNTSSLLQLPIRILVTIANAFRRSSKNGTSFTIVGILKKAGNLNFFGVGFTWTACISAVLAGFCYNDALRSGGSGTAVAAISGSSPAVSYFLSVILGLEKWETKKVLGVCLAVASCMCFASSKWRRLFDYCDKCAR